MHLFYLLRPSLVTFRFAEYSLAYTTAFVRFVYIFILFFILQLYLSKPWPEITLKTLSRRLNVSMKSPEHERTHRLMITIYLFFSLRADC